MGLRGRRRAHAAPPPAAGMRSAPRRIRSRQGARQGCTALPYPVHMARGERLRCTEGLRPPRPAACSGGRGRALTTHDRYCNFARSSNTMCRGRGRAAEASRPRPSSSAASLAYTSVCCEIRYLRAPGARASRSPAGPGRVCYAGCALNAARRRPACCPPAARVPAAAAGRCRGTRTRGASGARLGCTPVWRAAGLLVESAFLPEP